MTMPQEQKTINGNNREAELTALQCSFDEYIDSSRLLEEELEEELIKMEKQLSESNRANSTLMAQLENLTPQLSSLEKALAKANSRYEKESELRRRAELDQDEAEAKARASEGTIDALKEESDKAFQELAFKEEEMEELKVMLEVQKEKHQDELNNLRQEMDDMRHNIHVERKKKESDVENEAENESQFGLNNSNNSSMDDLREEKHKEALKEKDAYIKNLEDELELVTEELIESNDHTAQLLIQVGELKKLVPTEQDASIITNGASNVGSDENRTTTENVTIEITQLQQNVNKLSEENSILRNELELSQEELLLTQQELQAAELDLREATETSESNTHKHKEQVAALKLQLENAKLEVKSAKLEVDTITTSFYDSNHKNTAITEELDALNEAYENMKSDIVSLQEENVFLKKSFDQSKADITQKDEDLLELRTQLDALSNKERSMKSELEKNFEEDKNLHLALADTNDKLSNALVQLHKTKDEVLEWKAKFEEKNTANTNELTKQFETLKDQHHISIIRIKNLEEEVHRLETALRTEDEKPVETYAINESNLLPDDIQRIDNEKNRLDNILAKRDFDALEEEVKTLSKKSEMQREHNAQLLTKILRLQGNIQVCCRVRPMKRTEIADGLKVGVEALSETEVGCFDTRTQTWKSYAFDKVWGPNDGQTKVYQDVEPLALSVIDGYNSCIFAYGQTGSGKTHTMEGSSVNHQYGVSYRIIQKLFNLLEMKKRRHLNAGSVNDSPESKFDFLIEVGMLEIYNEDIYDLLTKSSPSERRNSNAKKTSLDIRRGANKMIEVVGLTKEKVGCIQDVIDLLKRGNSNRAKAATNLNEDSSRSHMVLNVRVTSGIPSETQSIGNLFLVDLAGSERVLKSGVEGKEMKEAQHINKSLSALGNVMEALDRKASHIPYRNSKLTYLLQDALSGNSKTMMIATVCPTTVTFDETSTVLQFATRARRINLGVAQKNIKSKNLEETVKNLTAEMKMLAKAKEHKEEQLIELKKSHERIQERLVKSQDSRNKVVEQESRTMAVLRKNNVDLVARHQKEKALRESKVMELEQSQQEVARTQQHLSRVNRDRAASDSKILTLENEILALKKEIRKSNDALSASNIRLRTSQIMQNGQSPKTRPLPPRRIYGSKKPIVELPSEEQSAMHEKVLVLLKKYDPKKADKIDSLMEKWKGKEEKLLTKLIDRYESDNHSTQSELTTESKQAMNRSQLAMQRHKERMQSLRRAKGNGSSSSKD